MVFQDINDLFRIYPNRNLELRALCKKFYEYGRNTSQLPSAAATNGLDEHDVGRQRQMIEAARERIDRLQARPIPDTAGTHPLNAEINFSVAFDWFVEDMQGVNVPINEDTQLLSELWLKLGVAMARSDSAAIGGSLINFDYVRATNNLAHIEEMVDTMEATPAVDLIETALPGAELKPRSGTSSAKK